MTLNIEEMATFCKKKGFVYPSAEIYGGLSGFYDFGPLGVELKNNIKKEWWKTHVTSRRDIVGIDGSIITNPEVWKASGHVENFTDILLKCDKCDNSHRADHLIEDKLKLNAEGKTIEELNNIIVEHKIKCPNCGGNLTAAEPFNLMFDLTIGPKADEGNRSYLRPETAQLIFTNFKLIADNARLKLPFGIAQIGKAFRNEISPRDFLFRSREFEQMEIEYFIHPKMEGSCPFVVDFENDSLNIFTAEMQEKKKAPENMNLGDALKKKVFKTPWHAYWLVYEQKWFVSNGAKPDHFRVRQHLSEEKSHYAKDTWDLEYKFPFGWKELQGVANRSDFDLQQHIKHSKTDLSLFNPQTNEKIVPYVVAEPSLGVERSFLVFMFDAYDDDKKRGNVVLHLHSNIAPYKVAIFPLLSNKEELINKSKEIFDDLNKSFSVFYDQSGSIGRRYARQDEIGTPYCITVDFDSIKNDDVTIRDRDSTKQVRKSIKELREYLSKLMLGKEKIA